MGGDWLFPQPQLLTWGRGLALCSLSSDLRGGRGRGLAPCGSLGNKFGGRGEGGKGGAGGQVQEVARFPLQREHGAWGGSPDSLQPLR